MSKYRAVRTEIDGVMFASKAEAARYCDLKVLERSGYISGLKLQPRFPLIVAGKKVCDYVADFGYLEKAGKPVIEDVKGMKTPVYRLKFKLFHACYPDLRITEIMKESR